MVYKAYIALEIRIVCAAIAQSVERVSTGWTVRGWNTCERGARFSAPVETGSGAHPASCTVDTGCLSPEVTRSEREVDHLPHIAPRLKKE